MATAGLVGGLGPESTVDYYRRILAAWERGAPGSAPSLLIDSLDVARGLRLAGSDRAGLAEYLLASLRRLAAAGADFAALTANTPHLVFDELAARSPVPLVSIVEACAAAARARGLRRVALLGTRFTMEAPFYPEVCARHGVAVVAPPEADRAWVHARYVGELLRGELRDETRRGFAALVARLRDAHGVDGVVLGGTELPLLLPGDEVAGLPALDTTALHVEAIVARLRGGAPADAAPPAHVPTRGLYGHVTHTDLASREPAATRAWCARVLGWEFRPPFPTPGGEYHLFAYSAAGGGGVRTVEAGGAPGSVPFVHVADARAAFDAAVLAGAEPLRPPERVMEGVTVAVVRAPGGVEIGLSGP